MLTNKFKPDGYSYVARNIVAPLWANREHSPYLAHLKYLETSSYRPLVDVRTDQWRRLRRLLFHAYLHTDYYSQLMKSVELLPDDIRNWDDFSKLPILTTDDIRCQKESMVALNVPHETLVAKKVFDSTGVPFNFFVDEPSRQWKRACMIRHDQWTGWRFGEKVGAVWENSNDRKCWRGYLHNFLLERFIYLDTPHMDEASMHRFYRKLRRRKPTLLLGRAPSLYRFGGFLRKEELDGIYPKGIVSTGKMLRDDERQMIEAVFNCKVTQRYGCEEVDLIASECLQHDGLHLNLDTLVIELIRDSKPVPPGEPGVFVVTDLSNYGMPLIRYQIGAVGCLSSRTACDCGCTYPIVELLQERGS